MVLSMIPWKMWVGGGLIIAAITAFGYVRWDAIQDERRRQKLIELENRLETITDVGERRNVIESLDDCDLIHDAIERLSGSAEDARAALHRCREEASSDQTKDGDVSGSE